MTKLRVFEAFSGIGTQTMGLSRANIDHDVVAISEIDTYAIRSYEAIHGSVNNLGDISQIDTKTIPDHDLFTYSFPCQSISVAGLQHGLDPNSGTRSSLLWECQKVIDIKRPKYLLMENVKNLVGKTHKHNFDLWLEWLESKGYTIVDVESVALPKTDEKTAVDANVDHFDTTDGQTSLKPELLDRLYKRVNAYQRQLARKRNVNKNYRHSKGYRATRAKLQATYERIRNVQNDLLHKFTTDLYRQFDTVVIEDLDVKGMQMKKKAKNLHRSLFGRFRKFMEYKAEKFGKTLIIADRFYPSTQRCSNCGHVKTGDEKITLSGNQKHGTKHHEYVCYECGYEDDRDHNAVLNLLALAE